MKISKKKIQQIVAENIFDLFIAPKKVHTMKISQRQLKRMIKEEKAKLKEAGPNYPKHAFPEKTPAKQGAAMTTSGDPQSYHDLATRMDKITLLIEDLSMDYVDSGWLKGGDHASLANDLDNLFSNSDRLAMAVMGLARSMGDIE